MNGEWLLGTDMGLEVSRVGFRGHRVASELGEVMGRVSRNNAFSG
jgi:hypothetical protein